MKPHPDSPIEVYLDELLSVSQGDPRRVRNMVAEAEAHLHDAADAGVASGLDRIEAEARAVARFGSARSIAEAERRGATMPVGTLARQGLLSALWLGSIAAVAVGLSGLMAAVLGAIWGSRFLVETPTTSQLTRSACARWLANSPAPTCAKAAIADWSFETVGYRVALGVLGIGGLMIWTIARRRMAHRGRAVSLPTAITDTVAVTAFGVAGVWLAGRGIDALVINSGHGSGQWLSAAPIALALAAAFAWRLMITLRNQSDEVVPDRA